MKPKNIFEKIPFKSDEEIFETLLKVKNVRIEKIISTGQKSPENFWYDQDEDEFVLLIQGSAKIEFYENEIVKMEKGDSIFIPAHKKHRVAETGENQPTVWLAVFISEK